MLHMNGSVSILKMMTDELQKASVDIGYMKTTYKNLQVLIENEFSVSDHRRRCMGYFAASMRRAMKSNVAEVTRVLNDPQIATIPVDRVNAYKLLNELSRILLAGSGSDRDKAIGLSFAYSHAVEGVYKKSVQECYIWHKLGVREHIDTKAVPRMDVAKVRDYYTSKNLDTSIFEGYNRTVRNAVSHTTFRFDDTIQKMIYEDRQSGDKATYSFMELHSLYQNIWDVLELMLAKNQVLIVHDVCMAIFKRKGETKLMP